MSRKTSSISLRLKKTNRDFDDCWYAGILYTQNLCKSFKIKSHLLQAFKAITVPCPHLSMIGGHKKSAIVVSYLDPRLSREKRFERLHLKAYSKPLINTGPAAGLSKDFFVAKLASNSKGSKKVGERGLSLQATASPSLLQLLGKGTFKGPLSLLPAVEGLLYLYGNLIIKKTEIFAELASFASQEAKEASSAKETKEAKASKARLVASFAACKAKQITEQALLMHQRYNPAVFCFAKEKVSKEQKAEAFVVLASCSASPEKSKQLQSTSPAWQTFVLPSKIKNLSLPVYNIFSLIYTLFAYALASFASQEAKEAKEAKEVSTVKEAQAQQNSEVSLSNFSVVGSKSRKGYHRADLMLCSWFSQRKSIFCYLSKEKMAEIGLAKPEKAYLAVGLAKQKQSKARSEKQANPFLHSASTCLFPKSSNVEEIRPYLRRIQSAYSDFLGNSICISFYKSINDTSSALFLANAIAALLERRVPFRRFKTHFLSELSSSVPRGSLLAKQKPDLNSLQAKTFPNLFASSAPFASCLQSKAKEAKTKGATASCSVESLQALLASCLQSKAKGLQARAKGVAPSVQKQGDSYKGKPSVFQQHLSKIAGVRVYSSGRVGGGASKKAQRARKEKLMWGETSLHVFSSKLDFAQSTAKTAFGSTGIKVWICYR